MKIQPMLLDSSGRYGWNAKYIYADLGQCLNLIPRFNGDTGIKGHEFAIGYKVNKRVSLGLVSRKMM